MRCRTFGVLVLLATFWAASPAAWAGIDEEYRKPAGKKTWGELLLDFVGHPGVGKSYALVVGISKFDDFSSLPTANDPLRMRDFLINEAGFDYVHVLTDEKATRARITELMVDVLPGMIADNDQFLFYWSGHGTQRPNALGGQIGYLPLAGSPKNRYATMISMGDIQRWDEVLPAKQALFLLDACFSGLAGSAGKSDPRELQIDQLDKPAHHLVSAGTAEEETIAGDRWGGSIFTDAVLRAVRGEADARTSYPRDGVVSLSELISYVKTRVAIEAPAAGWTRPITPQPYNLRSNAGEFFFLTDERKLAKLESADAQYQGRFEHGMPVVVMGAAPAPACDRDADRLFWEAIKSESAPGYFKAYLKRVESGELCGLFADIARLKLEAPVTTRPPVSEPAPQQPAAAVDPDSREAEALMQRRNVLVQHRDALQNRLDTLAAAIGSIPDSVGSIPDSVGDAVSAQQVNQTELQRLEQENRELKQAIDQMLKPLPSSGATEPEPDALEATLNLRTEDRIVIQEALSALDFDTQGTDGLFGANTRKAIAAWQRAKGEQPTSYLTPSQYGRLLAEAKPKLAALESARQKPEQASPLQPAVGMYEQSRKPGDEFRDCEQCPLMVVLPAGSFTMGSPESEEEGPEHDVTIAEPFAVGRYEVTFDEWQACIAGDGCNSYTPSDRDWGRGRRPVIDVSWQDAKAYVEWLGKETNQPYRLLSEAEWEFAARAHTTTRYWWGDDIRPANANYGANVGKTAEVGSYPPNPWGLHDMNGNVWEWVEDCWNGSYEGAPDDGSAWTSGDCSGRVLRGGSWSSIPWILHSAYRGRGSSDGRDFSLGFRVSRTLR